MPAVTGYNLPVEAVIALSEHPNIVGIKDSSGIPERIGQIRRGCPDDFLIYAGASRALEASRLVGATGAITASGNYASALVTAIVNRPPTEAGVAAAQSELTELAGAVEAFGIPGTKVAATLAGLSAGLPRAPLESLDTDSAAIVRGALASFLRPAD